MRSQNSKPITDAEREHLGRVKALPCGVCDRPGPSEAHHLAQGLHWACIPLCVSCHRGPLLGWHGQKRAWTVRKLDELTVLNETIKRLNDA